MTLSTYHFCHSITNSHFSHNTTQLYYEKSTKPQSRAPRPNAILLKFNIYLFVCPLLFKYVKPTHYFSLPPQDKYCSSQYNPFLSPIVKKVFAFFLALGLGRSTFPPFLSFNYSFPIIIYIHLTTNFLLFFLFLYFIFFTTNGL